jgi:hypothetical protein
VALRRQCAVLPLFFNPKPDIERKKEIKGGNEGRLTALPMPQELFPGDVVVVETRPGWHSVPGVRFSIVMHVFRWARRAPLSGCGGGGREGLEARGQGKARWIGV